MFIILLLTAAATTNSSYNHNLNINKKVQLLKLLQVSMNQYYHYK